MKVSFCVKKTQTCDLLPRIFVCLFVLLVRQMEMMWDSRDDVRVTEKMFESRLYFINSGKRQYYKNSSSSSTFELT